RQPCYQMPNWKWLQSKWTGLLIVAAIFFFMAALSWRKWADIVVDFGMQLYIPWRLSEGDVLYRDVIYLPGGPFSQYFNALLFKIFGASIRTLIFANLTITVAMLVLIYRQFLAAADRWTATTIASIIVIGFAFANYGDGNYNYIAPYCHEALHGLALSILAIALLTHWAQKRRWLSIFGAGFCYGIVFLTKPEIFLALSAGTLAAFTLIFKSGGKFNFITKSFATFAIAALIAPLFFFFLFSRIENWQDSLRSTAFAWMPLMHHSFAENAYYKRFLGLDRPLANFWKMIWQFAVITAVTILYAAFFRRKIISSRDRIYMLALGAALLVVVSEINWAVDRFLPLVALTLCAFLWLNSKKLGIQNRFTFPFLWSVFGLVLLAKMGLFSRIWHYGFILGMPAFAGMIYLLLWLLPTELEKYGVQRRPFRLLVGCAVVFIGLQLLMPSLNNYQKLNFPVGNGGDKIIAANTETDQRGLAVGTAISWLNTNAPANATLAVVPEGAMVNYLARRVNPTRYPVWMPPE
ncbi:MAG TPA: hypothetical protein VN516_02865, partial [Candidatus Baltobacteraceae bacterium]|nr:hypothetical protein [Candidatus Baltobacteraceae bacterium]